MSLEGTLIGGMIKHKADWLTQRHRIISQNIANVNTPDYQDRDLKKIDFRQRINQFESSFKLAGNDAQHIQSQVSGGFKSNEVRFPNEVSPDKNGVSIEEQIQKESATQAQFQLTVGFMKSYHSMYLTAIGKSA